MKNKLYYQQDNGAVYIHLDGGLRHIPNPDTFLNLFAGSIQPSEYINFPNASAAPLTILTNWPIMDNARLVDTTNHAQGILLEDKYPWSDTVVLRHVINPNQMNTLGFDWNKVVRYEETVHIGVPLKIESNYNTNAIYFLDGYHNLYGNFYFGSPLNPYFQQLAAQFPGNPKSKYKAQLKALIAEYQKTVSNLPGSVPTGVSSEEPVAIS